MPGERKTIRCGPVGLVDTGNGRLFGRREKLRLTLFDLDDGRWAWVCGGLPGIPTQATESDFDTPEAAAEDLARFLGELHEATEPWKESDDGTD